jgi:GNAT superfamily N-acetyltransferase
MKVNEITEAINTSIMKQGWQTQAHRGGLDLKAQANEQGLSVLAYDAGGREIGWAHFEIIDNDLKSFDTWVDPRMRRQGIATVIYNYAQELGNDIKPSPHQTRAGKRFWKARV